jgi:hypothetical protein
MPKPPAADRRRKESASGSAGGRRPSRRVLVAALAFLALVQVSAVRDRLALPFLDTRLHYHWDSAALSFDARSGLRAGDLRSQFGTTIAAYDRWGERTGPLSHYTDHPFLLKALFQQTARLTGTPEWASRAFYLAVSFGIAAGLFAALLQATSDVAAALAAGLVLVSIPLFSTFQLTAKYELDGMLLGVWQIVALGAFLKRPGPGTRTALVAVTALAPLAHWTAALSSVTTVLWLAARRARRRDVPSRTALALVVAGGLAGAALLAGLMVYLRGGAGGAWAPLTESFARRSASVPAGEWFARQGLYLGANFGWLLLSAVSAIAVAALAGAGRRPRGAAPASDGPGLSLLFVATATTGALWVLLFPQGSTIHRYWQLWLVLPAAAAVGAFVAALKGRRGPRIAAGVAVALLCLHLRGLAAGDYAGVLADQLGTPADIEFLASLRNDRFSRFVFIPLTEDPLNDWFQGPGFPYYTDRGVAILEPDRSPRAGEKLLVLRFDGREAALRAIGAQFGLRFTNEKCGPRFCALDVENAAAPAPPGGAEASIRELTARSPAS